MLRLCDLKHLLLIVGVLALNFSLTLSSYGEELVCKTQLKCDKCSNNTCDGVLVLPADSFKVENTLNTKLSPYQLYLPLFTFIISLISLFFSFRTRKDGQVRHNSTIKKSLYDDHWYRTVIHPQCFGEIKKFFEECQAKVKSEKNKTKAVNRATLDSLLQFVKTKKCKVESDLNLMSIMPKGNDYISKTQNILSSYEDAITLLVTLMLEPDSVPEEDLSQFCFFTEDIEELNTKPLLELTRVFFSLHESLSTYE